MVFYLTGMSQQGAWRDNLTNQAIADRRMIEPIWQNLITELLHDATDVGIFQFAQIDET